MGIERIVVFLPCHSLEDFPTWLDEAEADALLAAWTAAWDPALIDAVGRMPGWASAEVPPHDDAAFLAIVPPSCDERVEAFRAATCQAGSAWVRGHRDREAIVAEARAASGRPPIATPLAADFHALGLAWLLAELLARRMRSGAARGGADLETAVVAAARAAVGGDEAVARERLGEAYATLEAARGHYYPVDVWLLDLVLLAETTLGGRLAGELAAPTPWVAIATGALVERLAATDAVLAARLRQAIADGRVSPAGGRDDDAPLDAWTPERILASFVRGRRAWRDHLGATPRCFARFSGGSSPLLPQILQQLGYEGAVWNQFDGSPSPEPGASRIRWEGGGGSIEAVAKKPLDARHASSILRLADRLGDAMDHDHTAVLTFAHHAGTASRWFDDLRRISTWTGVLGRFVGPEEFFRRTTGAGGAVGLDPDAYPPSPPGPTDSGDPVAGRRAEAVGEAGDLLAARAAVGSLWPPAEEVPPAAGPRVPAARRGMFDRWRHRAASDRLVLEARGLRVRVHPQTGGILSLRASGERGNRLSQALAIRTTRPAPAAGAPWEDALERADYTRMVADAIERDADGVLESRGKLLSGDRDVGRFRQRVAIDARLSLVRIEVAVDGFRREGAPWLEAYPCCRFAWNENDDVDIRRGQATQSVVSERTLLSAPHFLEIVAGAAASGSGTTILTGGLPWHVRSSPHMIDCLLPDGLPDPGADGAPPGGSPGEARSGAASAFLAVGIGIRRPWELGLAFTASPDGSLPLPTPGVPDTVRLTGWVPQENAAPGAITVGVLEVAGRGGDVAIEWPLPVASARSCDALGRTVDGLAVAVAGSRTTFHLRRYGWTLLELRFADGAAEMSA